VEIAEPLITPIRNSRTANFGDDCHSNQSSLSCQWSFY